MLLLAVNVKSIDFGAIQQRQPANVARYMPKGTSGDTTCTGTSKDILIASLLILILFYVLVEMCMQYLFRIKPTNSYYVFIL